MVSVRRLVIAVVLIVIVLFSVFLFSAQARFVVRHFWYYSDAEQVTDKLREIYLPTCSLTAGEVESQLRVDSRFKDLMPVSANELSSGDLVLFPVNDMFTVGLRVDGTSVWVIDGVRARID